MTKYIIELNGKQFLVAPGDHLITDRINQEAGSTLTLDKVLAKVEEDSVELGHPHLESQHLSATIIEHLRGPKIRVATYKSKSRSRKVMGHRQDQTKIEILTSATPKKSPAKKTK